MIRLLDLLDTVEAFGCRLDRPRGRLRLVGPAVQRNALRADLLHHRDLLEAHIVGIYHGHLLAFCDRCREPTITAAKKPNGDPRDNWPACRMTPGCEGAHRPRPTDLELTRNAKPPPPQPKPPRRPAKARLLGPRPAWPTHPTGTPC